MNKDFHLHFRYRSTLGHLETLYETIQTTSQKKAREIGKETAALRALDNNGKYWFMGLEPSNPQKSVTTLPQDGRTGSEPGRMVG